MKIIKKSSKSEGQLSEEKGQKGKQTAVRGINGEGNSNGTNALWRNT